MTWPWWVVGLLAAGLAIDRVAVWAERRGWIHWRSRGVASGGGGPFHDVFLLLQPSRQHVVEEQDRQRLEIVRPDSGDPPPEVPVGLDVGTLVLPPDPDDGPGSPDVRRGGAGRDR